jgi:hypothetical protein
MKSLVLCALMSCLYASLAWSQCAPGVPSAGNPGCIPPNQQNSPYYQGSAVQQQPATQPKAVWADRWGAIVIDSQTGRGKGTAIGYASRESAIDAAMSECTSQGAPSCKLALSFHNQCAAVAWGSTYHFTAGDPIQSEAESDALQHCNEATSNCKIVYSACSLAERVK